MKGQILQTFQSARSNFYLCGVLCALFIATGFSIEQRVLAAESTNSHRRNSIVVPADSATDENPTVINPSPTNRIREDGSVIDLTNISDPREMLRLYADLRGRTIRWPTNLSLPNVTFTADKPLNRQETTLALDALFGLNGVALIDIGEKWVNAARSESCQTSGNLNYETVAHLRHLTYLKPTELIPILQPFCSGANAILPLNADQALLLRDRPENVHRMLEVIQEVDVALPTEFISEIIPIKYAKASDIAAALHKSAPLEWKAKHRPVSENIVESGQDKVIADERTNSLLVYASREEMKQIKQIISRLDVVAAQILIEAVIIEINRTNGFAIKGIDDQEFSWMTNFVPIAVTNAPPAVEPTRPTRASGKAGFYRFAAISNDLDSFVTTLASNKSVRILQRPRIQTSDDEPAQLFVGESRPLEDMYPSGAYTCGSGGSAYSSIQAINLGVTLELTPSITSDKSVALDIHQSIEKANGSVTIENVGEVPITYRTEQSAKVIVRDRDVLLLDGSEERANTPLSPGKLKRMLTLNGLFHHSKSVTNHNELIILIRPTILPTPEVASLSKAEKDKMPGVKRAELDLQSEERIRLQQLEKQIKSDRDRFKR